MEPNEKTELQVLLERKQKADNIYNTAPESLPMNQVKLYLDIKKRIYFLETTKFLVVSAPLTMNPEKINEHIKYMLDAVRDLIQNNENLGKYLENGKNFFTNYNITHVEQYKKDVVRFMNKLIVLWKNENNYK